MMGYKHIYNINDMTIFEKKISKTLRNFIW